MTNKEVAKHFNQLAKIMELHGENPFKIRSYAGAYNTIRRHPKELNTMSREELLKVSGIGKNIADKIIELLTTGFISTLDKYLDETPAGIVEMLALKGFGPKKILAVWKDLEIETPGELLYACEENRLVDLKGFGEKTQEDLKNKLIYFLDARGKYLYGHVVSEARELLHLIQSKFTSYQFEFINDIRRQMPIVHQIDIIGTAPHTEIYEWISRLEGYVSEEDKNTYKGTKALYEEVDRSDFHRILFEGSASSDFLDEWEKRFGDIINEEDEVVMDKYGLYYIPPESREVPGVIQHVASNKLEIIADADIKGVIHCHTTYSDGANTLEEMVEECVKSGYEYILITDHSKSAFYANGLKEEDVLKQLKAIDELNQSIKGIKIFKGIESDILYNGLLDYDDDLLEQFDVVIASVHSNLKMDIKKATDRVITAINNPYTRILGHPTGRLLLSREGYPLDHMEVIDACAQNGTVIELNANPYRLDLDWTWIPYAMERGVLISINPDAHNTGGISDIQYGVCAARKALLSPSLCLNALTLPEFEKWVYNR